MPNGAYMYALVELIDQNIRNWIKIYLVRSPTSNSITYDLIVLPTYSIILSKLAQININTLINVILSLLWNDYESECWMFFGKNRQNITLPTNQNTNEKKAK